MDDSFYVAFENKFRGSRELISTRLDAYLPFIVPLRDVLAELPALDLGCGRGEWLEKVSSLGLKAVGVDINEKMLAECKGRGLDVVLGDALKVLRETADNSISIISAFHVVEHLNFDDVIAIAKESLRALAPGGLLILETPNPENFRVGSCDFYLDPTHVRPIPPELLAFVPDYHGFETTTILRLQGISDIAANGTASLQDVLIETSRDYAVVSQKSGNQHLTEALSPLFTSRQGNSTFDIIAAFDQHSSIAD